MPVLATVYRFVLSTSLAFSTISGSAAYSATTDLEAVIIAADAGDPDAQRELGEALLYGLGTDANPERAKALLQAAADKGNIRAGRVLGEQLIGGWLLEPNVPQGLALLDAAALSGDAQAQIALGKLLLYGEQLPKDKARALALFETAATLGNGGGLLAFGENMMWRGTDPAAAQTYLERAAELGNGAAWTLLAEGTMYGYLGEDRRRFTEFAAKAVENGETEIALLEAQRQLYGISMRASGPLAIEGLEQAANAGNADAARFLIMLVRDGNQLNVRKRPDQASAYLQKYEALFKEDDKRRLAFTITAARNRDSSRFSAMAADFDKLADLHDAAFAKDIYSANPNFTIYLLQRRWKQSGEYNGAADGYAGKKTLQALHAACLKLPTTNPCDHSLVDPKVIGQLIAQ